MARNDKEPDYVEHGREVWIPILSEPHKTVIHKGEDTCTGYGWTRDDADKSAGEKCGNGEKDG